MSIVTCNKCNKDFKIRLKTKNHEEGIQETYFTCYHCEEKYTSYYTNKQIRDKQKEIRNLQKMYRTPRTSEEAGRIFNDIKKIHSQLKILMESLEMKMIRKGQ